MRDHFFFMTPYPTKEVYFKQPQKVLITKVNECAFSDFMI